MRLKPSHPNLKLRITTLLFCATLCASAATVRSKSNEGETRAQQQELPRSYSFPYGEEEAKLESDFQRIPDPKRAESDLRWITANPHMAGTEGSHKVAQWLAEQYRSYGFDIDIVSYSVWLPQPSEIKLELIEPQKRTLGTQEQPYPQDEDSQNRHLFPAFNSYAASGDVTAPVVYVNYGAPEDYKYLDSMGVDVAGKIVLARYGKSYRGIKAKLAEEHHAAALLIYSDPYDDGYDAGDVFPAGPWRPFSGIQRGSVLYTEIYPGDPLTPGIAATPHIAGTPDAPRISPDQAANLPRIPTLPINAQDAENILSHLAGAKIPRDWQGGLPFTYHAGPGTVVHLKVAMDYRQRTIYDVIAKLPGLDAKGTSPQWVILGNHHDAWVYGAVDPGSGTAVMLETARALGEMVRKGWKPQRTIVMCEWDGEEEGLLGSTEWVEQNLKELQQKAVVYINVDVGVAGPNFGGGATPSLKGMLVEATREVTYPQQPYTVFETWRDRTKKARAQNPDARQFQNMMQGEEVPVGDLGAGSDFCAFFDHAGIPSMDLGFGGDYGVYHSMYDDFYWMKHFGDPTFEFHATLAKVLGILTLRFANLGGGYDFTAYADRILREVKSLADRADKAHMNDLNLHALQAAAGDLRSAIYMTDTRPGPPGHQTEQEIQAQIEAYRQRPHPLATEEQAFLSPRGLIGRPWYKHTLFAPGSYAGYASVMMPGLAEAIDRHDSATAQKEADEITAALTRATSQMHLMYRTMIE